RGINKSVDITMYRNFISLTVKGTDQTWVLGKFQQLRKFLEERSPWYWRFSAVYPFATSAVIILVALAFDFLTKTSISLAATIGIFGVVWVIGFAAQIKGVFLPHVRILIGPKRSPLNRENLILIVELATLLATVLGLILRV
ncbi:MAG: hypothetical protein OK452_07330, partial [Thaumarchaeota archaeon]|nr:hypothetical protein [Nitrososphaerota archaeon]